MKSVKNKQGFPLHQSPCMPACFSHTDRGGLPPTMSGTSALLTLVLYLSLHREVTILHTRLLCCHITAGQGSSKPAQLSENFGLPELWWARDYKQSNNVAREPNYPMQLLVKQVGEKKSFSTSIRRQYTCSGKSSYTFRAASSPEGIREAGYAASALYHFLAKCHKI